MNWIGMINSNGRKNKKRRSPKMDALKTLIAKTGYEKIRSAGHVKPPVCLCKANWGLLMVLFQGIRVRESIMTLSANKAVLYISHLKPLSLEAVQTRCTAPSTFLRSVPPDYTQSLVWHTPPQRKSGRAGLPPWPAMPGSFHTTHLLLF